MKMVTARTITLILMTLLMTGCGTVGTFPQIYGGTIHDVKEISDPAPREAHPGIFMIFELPFCLILDTILLPVTLGTNLFSDAEPQADPTSIEKK